MFGLSTPRPNALVATMTSVGRRHERVLRLVALVLVHPAVVARDRDAPARQRLVELLDLLDRRAVDDARPRQLLEQRDERLHLLVVVGEDDHLVVQVRAIERRRDDRRLLDPELEQDVVADVRRRGRGRREHRRAADILERLAQRQVRGPEVVAPLRHAVRLVDDEPRHADAARRFAQEHAELGIGHALGRGEQQLAAGRAHQRVDLAALLHGQRRVDLRTAVTPFATILSS